MVSQIERKLSEANGRRVESTMIIVEDASQDLTTFDFANCGWFSSRNGGLLVKRLMGSAAVVVVDEFP
jgi:hypothetical protein